MEIPISAASGGGLRRFLYRVHMEWQRSKFIPKRGSAQNKLQEFPLSPKKAGEFIQSKGISTEEKNIFH